MRTIEFRMSAPLDSSGSSSSAGRQRGAVVRWLLNGRRLSPECCTWDFIFLYNNNKLTAQRTPLPPPHTHTMCICAHSNDSNDQRTNCACCLFSTHYCQCRSARCDKIHTQCSNPSTRVPGARRRRVAPPVRFTIDVRHARIARCSLSSSECD